MKTTAISSLVLVFSLAFGAALALLRAEPMPADGKPDPWKPLRILIGKWEGDSNGEPGAGKTEREYAFILNNRFIQVRNKSVYPPREKNPKGETHQDIDFYSYDKAVKKLVLRQFHIEGFVNQFILASVSDDGRTIVFITNAIENIAPGWRARETYQILNHDEFIETFAMAEPNHDFATYTETHFRRRSP